MANLLVRQGPSGVDMVKEMNTKSGAMAAELCRMQKLQKEQCELQGQQLELQHKAIELHQLICS